MTNTVTYHDGTLPYGPALNPDWTLVYPWWNRPWCDRCQCAPCSCTSSVNTILSIPAPSEKVRLSPAELDTLRKAAAENDDLRAVLQKLRGKIEVEVDFEP